MTREYRENPLEGVDKVVVTCPRDNIPNKPFRNDAKIGFETSACPRFLTIIEMRDFLL